MSASRDQADTAVRYLNPDGPRDDNVQTVLGEFSDVLTLGESPGDTKEEYKKRRARVAAEHQLTIFDARDEDGGVDAWDLERNGFTTAEAPEPAADFSDRRMLAKHYVPRVLELVRQTFKASRAFSAGFQTRTEATGRGTSQASYARFAHSDYGPESEPQLRRILSHRYGLSETEAQTRELCCVGFWAPIDRPAYQDPLCLLDAASFDPEKLSEQSIRLLYSGLSLGSLNKDRAIEERIPVPAGDVPALAPIYSPDHRWRYIPDMTPEQALIFKQYDWRKGVASRVCFHNSFRDRFHQDWEDCPGRRSIEVRVFLTF